MWVFQHLLTPSIRIFTFALWCTGGLHRVACLHLDPLIGKQLCVLSPAANVCMSRERKECSSVSILPTNFFKAQEERSSGYWVSLTLGLALDFSYSLWNGLNILNLSEKFIMFKMENQKLLWPWIWWRGFREPQWNSLPLNSASASLYFHDIVENL